jgi:hypothetical protein
VPPAGMVGLEGRIAVEVAASDRQGLSAALGGTLSNPTPIVAEREDLIAGVGVALEDGHLPLAVGVSVMAGRAHVVERGRAEP